MIKLIKLINYENQNVAQFRQPDCELKLKSKLRKRKRHFITTHWLL